MTQSPRQPRREFLATLAAGAAGLAFASQTRADEITPPPFNAPKGYFGVIRKNGRWWFRTPDEKPYFSLGLNHIDSAALRLPGAKKLWTDRYGNSMERWLKESVGPNLRAWKFNSVGWNQEVVTRTLTNHRHSRSWTLEEYRWLGFPFCHMLPFAEIHQWEAETRHPDFRSPDFAEWCDVVAREQCARFRDEPNLIGYFYSDCPSWVHTRPENKWKGPLFDPERLKTDAGRRDLFELATTYYRVTHDAVRRYDPNHLILGDRYEANAPLPQEVVRASLPFVDVLSFQCFGDPSRVREKLSPWAKLFDRPLLLADHNVLFPLKEGEIAGKIDRFHDPRGYAATLDVLKEIPQAVGYHLCGAYLRNNARRSGLLDANEQPDTNAIPGVRRANEQFAAWMGQQVN